MQKDPHQRRRVLDYFGRRVDQWGNQGWWWWIIPLSVVAMGIVMLILIYLEAVSNR